MSGNNEYTIPIEFCNNIVVGRVASVVDQFNSLKGSKNDGEPPRQVNRTVEITAPIQDYRGSEDTKPAGITLPIDKKKYSELVSQGKGKRKDDSFWKDNPLFASTGGESDSDDDVPEIIKRFSINGLPPSGHQLSDTMSSDIIVNSISNG